MRVRTSSLTAASWMPPQHLAPENPVDFAQQFARVFDAHATFVWRVLRRLGIPDADADDAVQDVFIVVHDKLESYEERGSIRAWLFTISRQVASHRHRSARRRERTTGEAPAASRPEDPQEAAIRRQAIALVHDFLAELDYEQAIVFYLADVEEMTAPEIAASLGVKVNTIYGRLRLARKRFEQFIEQRSPEERRIP
jgi:RNA polymerase sigma-70 factor (ECF subfamily)